MASSVDTKLEYREELDSAIDSLRKSLNANEKQRLAASWIDKEDRSRIALVLGATRKEDDRMITKVSGDGFNENTTQQMRSRARKRAQEVLNSSKKLPLVLIACIGIISVVFSSTTSVAGEQTGGRRGLTVNQTHDSTPLHLHSSEIVPGEQSGGRKP